MSFGPAKIASSAPRPVAGSAGADWLDAPWWVQRLFVGVSQQAAIHGDLTIHSHVLPDVSLVSVRVAGAVDLPPAGFEQATAKAYSLIAERLGTLPASHPVRFWNFIPGIHAPSNDPARPGAAMDRYMVFNAGRYDACRTWLGGEDAFARLLATASGVGHQGADLIVHALATAEAGSAVENPRQVPAYQYSRRYGPKPPCFARATTVNLRGRRMLLIGGTASVRGEESVFVDDLRKQVGETLDNLAALLQAATADDTAGPHLMTDVRVYHVNPGDEPALRTIVAPAFPSARIEFVRADICRQDLLVEIEGVA